MFKFLTQRPRLWLALTGLLVLIGALLTLMRPAQGQPPAPRVSVVTWTPPPPADATVLNAPLPLSFLSTTTPTPALPTISPTPSPTARPGIDPTLGASTPDPAVTHELPIPSPVPQLYLSEGILNILLLGRDTARGTEAYRTDVIIIVSVNKTENTVTMLSIPRDLFVYIPGWTMNRINTAARHGEAVGYPGGGIALLEQTILYNLGIPIHGWALVDFSGFQNVVNILGDVEVAVTCQMTEWKLKDETLPLTDDNAADWELHTLEPGVHKLNGYMALWYARSRKRSSDFDRSRRQHQVLRAMFNKALQLNALPKVPELYAEYIEIVDTDMGLGDVLQFVPLAAQLNRNHIRSRFIGRNETYGYNTSQGARVLLPIPEVLAATVAEAFELSNSNVLERAATSVEIWNGTSNKDWATLAADNLEWSGFQPVSGQADATTYEKTLLYDFTTSAKNSMRARLQKLFRIKEAQVIAQPDPSAPYPYRLVLGRDYNSCITPLTFPQTGLTPTPSFEAAPPAANVAHAAAIVGQPPNMDGNLVEWTSLAYAIGQPGSGAENWHGPADLAAQWAAAWDVQNLYLAVRVKDEALVQLDGGETLFRGDSLELWVTTGDAGHGPGLTNADYLLGLSPGRWADSARQSEAFLWWPEHAKRKVEGLTISTQRQVDGYDLEIVVPWTVLNLNPFAEEVLAFTLALNDDDTPADASQDTQLTTVREADPTDPTSWGFLVLDPPP